MIPGRLIVSVTSHPPRYSHLRLVLEGLLRQSHKPDAIVLWLAPEEWNELPIHIQKMAGITIRACENVGPYKNIIPALAEYPDAYIVICGDDVIYPPGWLQRFADEYRSDGEILCQRAKEVKLVDGRIAPVIEWREVHEDEAGDFVFPIGVHGVMYPPNSLDAEVMNAEAFMRLAPKGDDIWKYWMGLKAGSVHRHIEPHELFQHLPTGARGLYQYNMHGGDAIQLGAMVEAYGLPWQKCEAAA